MNSWKLSLCYLRRKKVRTLILFVVFLTIGSSLISLMGIKHFLEKNLIGTQQRTIYLDSQEGNFWPAEVYTALQSASIVEQIESSMTIPVRSSLKQASEQAMLPEAGGLHLRACEDSASLKEFQGKKLILEAGRHLTKDDQNQVLVHKDLAEKNDLKPGSVLELSGKSAMVAGIYREANDGDSMQLQPSLSDTLMGSDALVTAIHGKKEYQSLQVRLKDEKAVNPVIQSIRQWQLDWGKYSVKTALELHGDAFQNLVTLHVLVGRLLKMFSILSICALVLMLNFWINNRIKETGILLAIGKSKLEVISHYLIEVLIVAAAAFSFSILVGMLLGQRLADTLLSQVSAGIATAAVNQGGLLAERLDVLSIAIGIPEILGMYALGALICFAAAAISSYSIVRLQPKQILLKMS